MVTRKPASPVPPRKPVAVHRPPVNRGLVVRRLFLIVAVLAIAGLYCGRTAFVWLNSPAAALAAPVRIAVEPTMRPAALPAALPQVTVPPTAPAPTVRPTDIPATATVVLPTATLPAPVGIAATSTPTRLPPSPTWVPTRTPQDPPSLLNDAAAGLASLAQKVAPGQKANPFTILLAVADARATANADSNAGAFLVGRVDTEKNTASWVALPADLQVEIPGQSSGRLDSVFAAGEKLLAGGGAPFLKQTLEQNLQITLSFYLVVDRESLAKGIDQSGMISITVPYALGEAAPSTDPYNAPAILRAGPQALDGLSLVEYLFARDRAGDVDHQNKGRAVADAVVKWANRPGAIEQAFIAIMDQTTHFKTNLRANQVLGLFWLLRQVKPTGLVLRQVDSTMTGANGAPRWDRIRPLFADWKK